MAESKNLPENIEKPKIIVNSEPQLAPIVADLSHNMIILSKEFNKFTQDMPEIIGNAKRVLGLEDEIKLDLDSMDDDEVEAALETLNKPMELWREFSGNRTQVNRQLTNFTNVFKSSIEEVAKGAGFDELDMLRNEGLRMKKEISANRKRKAWYEAYELYMNALQAYPQVQQVFPDLTKPDAFERIVTNFGLFKVTGAKSFKLTSTIKVSIADLAARLATLADATLHELASLPPETHGSILRTLVSQPDTETLYKQVQLQRTSLAARAQEEQLRKAREAEAAKAAQAAPGAAAQGVQAPVQGAAAATQPQQQAPLPFAQPAMTTQGHPVQLIAPLNDNGDFFQSARDWLLQVYIPQQGNAFYDVMTNPMTKLKLVFQISNQMQDPNSSVAKIINGNAEAGLTMLLAVQSI